MDELIFLCIENEKAAGETPAAFSWEEDRRHYPAFRPDTISSI